MKYKLIIALIFTHLAIVAQNSTEYEFESQIDSSNIVKLAISLPESWHIINETQGTPYDLVGFELLDQTSIALNDCSPNMRIGISILPGSINQTFESLGLFESSNGFYIFKDIDGYVNIVAVSVVENPKAKGVYFRIKKLSDCKSNEEKKRNKRKNRNTIDKTYILFSREEVTVCLESFNGEFTESSMNLIKSTFRFLN